MNVRNIVLYLLSIAILGLMAGWAAQFWKTDKCLDRGGRWNYERNTCEGARD
jgi:hypothetical protein